MKNKHFIANILTCSFLVSGLVSISVVAMEAILLPKPSFALCVANPLSGVWRNTDSNTRSITQVNFNPYNCEVDGPGDGSIAKLHLYGSCSPSDCSWGWAKVYPSTKGWYIAYYDQGFAERTVFVRQDNGRMSLVVRSTYKDNSGRANNETWDYFQKVGN